MGAKETSDFRRRRKENLLRVCGDKCAICGYNKLKAALEFHHIDPSQKEYAIASNGTCHDLEKDLNEVKKCLLVCANCHREIHAELFTTEELWKKQIYLDDVADELRRDKFQRLGTKEYSCKICNKKITKYSDSGLCADCVRTKQRKVERPSREELKKLIRYTPFTHIATQFEVSDNTIRKWCESVGLPSKVSKIKLFTDEEWDEL